jgi:3-polyprenyl-4-hydroxybenzoate decarboxylase
VIGHAMPVVGNLLPSIERMALALGVPPGNLQSTLVAAIERPIAARLVESAPCQDFLVPDPDLAGLPIPTFFEHEGGPYITAGAIVARDPDSGRGNLSIARLKPLGGNRAFIGIAPNHHLAVFARAAGLLRQVRASLPSVRAVAVGQGGAGRLHAVVSLGPHRPGDPRKAAFAVWAAVNLIKQVTIVDDDVDPWDGTQVEWAVATRMNAERDLFVIPAVRTDRSEPLERDGVVAKLGIDATRHQDDRTDWTRAAPPAEVVERVRAALARR